MSFPSTSEIYTHTSHNPFIQMHFRFKLTLFVSFHFIWCNPFDVTVLCRRCRHHQHLPLLLLLLPLLYPTLLVPVPSKSICICYHCKMSAKFWMFFSNYNFILVQPCLSRIRMISVPLVELKVGQIAQIIFTAINFIYLQSAIHRYPRIRKIGLDRIGSDSIAALAAVAANFFTSQLHLFMMFRHA